MAKVSSGIINDGRLSHFIGLLTVTMTMDPMRDIFIIEHDFGQVRIIGFIEPVILIFIGNRKDTGRMMRNHKDFLVPIRVKKV